MKMKTYRIRKSKIAVVDGDIGLPVILKGLRNQGADITAVVTVVGSGGNSSAVKESVAMASPGDLRNVLVVLPDVPQFYEDIFQYRFKKEDQFLANHTVGNLIIATVSEIRGSTYEAIQLLTRMVRVDGCAYPSSETPLTLHAVFKNGTTAIGESRIAVNRRTIDRVYVCNTNDKNEAKVARKVVSAIIDADIIILGPGSLFTSTLPSLVIPEIDGAMLKTIAKTVYICNIMTQEEGTEHFTNADHICILHKHLDQPFIDAVLASMEKVPEDYMNPEIHDEYLVRVAHGSNGLRNEGCRMVSIDFLELEDDGAFRNGGKVVEELFRLVFGSKY